VPVVDRIRFSFGSGTDSRKRSSRSSSNTSMINPQNALSRLPLHDLNLPGVVRYVTLLSSPDAEPQIRRLASASASRYLNRVTAPRRPEATGAHLDHGARPCSPFRKGWRYLRSSRGRGSPRRRS
jgi:hypothetical protein